MGLVSMTWRKQSLPNAWMTGPASDRKRSELHRLQLARTGLPCPCHIKLKLSFVCCILALLLAPVAFAQWEPDQRLTVADSSSHTSSGSARSIDVSGDTVHIVWRDRRDGNDEVYYQRSTDGGLHWGPTERLTNNSSDSQYPSLAVAGQRVHVVWHEYSSGWSDHNISYRHSLDGGDNWEQEVELVNDPYSHAWQPSVAARASMVHVVWMDSRWENFYSMIYSKRSTDGGATWGADMPLNYAPVFSVNPSVALSGSQVHVVWFETTENWEIHYRRSNDEGLTWELDTVLTGSAAPVWPNPLVSIAASGPNVHLVWEDYRDGNAEVYYKCSSDAGMTWSSDTRLTTDSAGSSSPTIAASGANVHVAWQDFREGNPEIYYKRSRDGGTIWEQETRLTNDPSSSQHPSIAVSGESVHVVWEDDRNGNWEVYYKRNPTGNIGVAESPGPCGPDLRPRLKISPNPFVSFARIPGYEGECFAVYDVSGRLLRTCLGAQVGKGLAPGVYLLKGPGQSETVQRIVKVR